MRPLAADTIWTHTDRPSGEWTTALTLANSPVRVWRGLAAAPADHRYFCHGHSLRTYERFGYTPYSGDDVQQVLDDEYYEVPGRRDVQINDIIAWLGAPKDGDWHAPHPRRTAAAGGAAFIIRHTARVVTPIVTGGKVDPAQTMVTTKNGVPVPPATLSIDAVSGTYEHGWTVYRKNKSD